VALTNGGKDNDENCVACCKALNALFGRISLKEKLRILLNQKGNFVCPASAATTTAKTASSSKTTSLDSSTLEGKLQIVITDLHKRGAAKPGTVEKLKNTMKSALRNDGTEEGLSALVQALQSSGAISVSDGKVAYHLPPRAP
jgi:hypothetical protein